MKKLRSRDVQRRDRYGSVNDANVCLLGDKWDEKLCLKRVQVLTELNPRFVCLLISLDMISPA